MVSRRRGGASPPHNSFPHLLVSSRFFLNLVMSPPHASSHTLPTSHHVTSSHSLLTSHSHFSYSLLLLPFLTLSFPHTSSSHLLAPTHQTSSSNYAFPLPSFSFSTYDPLPTLLPPLQNSQHFNTSFLRLLLTSLPVSLPNFASSPNSFSSLLASSSGVSFTPPLICFPLYTSSPLPLPRNFHYSPNSSLLIAPLSSHCLSPCHFLTHHLFPHLLLSLHCLSPCHFLTLHLFSKFLTSSHRLSHPPHLLLSLHCLSPCHFLTLHLLSKFLTSSHTSSHLFHFSHY
jgi:hypothetical protein